jgi:hypothetical protein
LIIGLLLKVQVVLLSKEYTNFQPQLTVDKQRNLAILDAKFLLPHDDQESSIFFTNLGERGFLNFTGRLAIKSPHEFLRGELKSKKLDLVTFAGCVVPLRILDVKAQCLAI